MPKFNWGETDDAEDYEDFLDKKSVRTRKKGKKEQRQNKNKKSEFVSDQESWRSELKKEAFVARVVEVHKRYAFVSPEPENLQVDTKDVWLATVSRRHLTSAKDERNFVAVGDVVLCYPAKEKDGLVTSDLPQCVIDQLGKRKSQISRIDPQRSDLMHVLASNIDQLFIVASYLKPTVKWGLIDRYLALAFVEGIAPVIVLNKADLLDELEEEERAEYLSRRDYLLKIGYEVIEIQANSPRKSKESIKRLAELLHDKVSLFSGHSGVGKSSIVNLFDPEIEQDVEPDEDIFYKGRHTTSYASFLKLRKGGGFIIDSPGVRSFCIPELTPVTLNHAFPDILPYAESCAFRMCRHVEEPDCGVKSAVERGELPEYRLRSYTGILLGASGREGRMRTIEI